MFKLIKRWRQCWSQSRLCLLRADYKYQGCWWNLKCLCTFNFITQPMHCFKKQWGWEELHSWLYKSCASGAAGSSCELCSEGLSTAYPFCNYNWGSQCSRLKNSFGNKMGSWKREEPPEWVCGPVQVSVRGSVGQTVLDKLCWMNCVGWTVVDQEANLFYGHCSHIPVCHCSAGRWGGHQAERWRKHLIHLEQNAQVRVEKNLSSLK